MSQQTSDRILQAIQSEHCSYKSTKKYLSDLYTEGAHIIQGPGENAGIIDIGNGYAIALRIESHNHPSFINPYEGAATGVGGILRDIFTMGARPIALLDFLRFQSEGVHLSEVARGISDYGNTMGIPVVGGDLLFHDSYKGNCLVNVCALGLVKHENIIYGNALTPWSKFIYVGARTGRDGIGGSEMASRTLTDLDESAIQSSDPFLEKLLMEACCELGETGWIEGMQDMGAAGLLCSTSEVVYRGRKKTGQNLGCILDLSKIPLKNGSMDAGDILLSESQERMLIVARQEYADDILALFREWDLEACVIGQVTETGEYHVIHGDETECRLDFSRLFPELHEEWEMCCQPELVDLPVKPSRKVRESIWKQYDWMVGARTVKGPNTSGDYAILDIPEAGQEVIVSWGVTTKHYLCERIADLFFSAYDQIRDLGGVPLALTNCLNFGHPATAITDFEITVGMMNALCKFYRVPIVSGNVSLYNNSQDTSIIPTPIFVMVGTRKSRQL